MQILTLALSLLLSLEAPVNTDMIHWLGHASFRIDDGAGTIYIDPWKLPAGAPKADVVLITHAHYDHCSAEDLAKIARATTIYVAPADVAAKLTGRRAIAAAAGGSYTAGPFKVEAVAAYNIGKAFHPQMNGWVGYVVTLPSGERIYHAGDTDATPEMKAVKADVAMLPCGGTYTGTAAEMAAAANIFKPAVLIPMHWGDIVGSQADADALAKGFTGKTLVLKAER
jgi:L-ascorbate metabolism protein UlaG (beta-lactamase superfamily)